jgi:hypothetical protein
MDHYPPNANTAQDAATKMDKTEGKQSTCHFTISEDAAPLHTQELSCILCNMFKHTHTHRHTHTKWSFVNAMHGFAICRLWRDCWGQKGAQDAVHWQKQTVQIVKLIPSLFQTALRQHRFSQVGETVVAPPQAKAGWDDGDAATNIRKIYG